MADLIDYYGAECTHCKAMEPIVKKLEKELKIKVERKEVWHNSANNTELKKLNPSGAVPFFFNKKTRKAILGEASFEKLKMWAQGK